MKYIEFKELLTDYVLGNLSNSKNQELELFLKENPGYYIELEEASFFLESIHDEIPEPTTSMDIKFYTMLNSEKAKEENISFVSKIEKFLSGNVFKKVAYSLTILTVGFFLGKGFNNKSDIEVQNIEKVQQEAETVRSQLVLTLLDQPSANKRLQAVSEVNKLNKVTETILQALFKTLNNDENVNVRLSAIEALGNYTEYPLVREGLIASILKQDSPLVQIALADLMVLLQEKAAIKSFEKILDEEDTNESVKQKMEESIERII
ncbi:HEAT repeat domain-containing protein [Tenacibaculum sp. MEBiC06402]|uniref:HEAT repeat domain-containing protein n=1 Tax=unclassified Tenacibaculum TaxID=2635139 RepID=UPI003B99FDD5